MPKELWFTPARLEKAINDALDNQAAKAKADFESTVATWDKKPTFQVAKEDFKRIVFTSDKNYKYLDEGTKVRYVIMIPGFVSKTMPGVLGSRPGRGGVLVHTKNPQPGIKARGWTDIIEKTNQAELTKIVQKLIADTVSGKR